MQASFMRRACTLLFPMSTHALRKPGTTICPPVDAGSSAFYEQGQALTGKPIWEHATGEGLFHTWSTPLADAGTRVTGGSHCPSPPCSAAACAPAPPPCAPPPSPPAPASRAGGAAAQCSIPRCPALPLPPRRTAPAQSWAARGWWTAPAAATRPAAAAAACPGSVRTRRCGGRYSRGSSPAGRHHRGSVIKQASTVAAQPCLECQAERHPRNRPTAALAHPDAPTTMPEAGRQPGGPTCGCGTARLAGCAAYSGCPCQGRQPSLSGPSRGVMRSTATSCVAIAAEKEPRNTPTSRSAGGASQRAGRGGVEVGPGQ